MKTLQVILMATAVGLSGAMSSAGAQEGDDAQAVSRGVTAWQNNCARCHNMRQPTEFRDDLWKPIVFHMRVRAGLTGQEARDILAFLQASN